jgi:hypothetical protein
MLHIIGHPACADQDHVALSSHIYDRKKNGVLHVLVYCPLRSGCKLLLIVLVVLDSYIDVYKHLDVGVHRHNIDLGSMMHGSITSHPKAQVQCG